MVDEDEGGFPAVQLGEDGVGVPLVVAELDGQRKGRQRVAQRAEIAALVRSALE